MDRILYISYSFENKRVASTIQNIRLIDSLKKYFEIDVIYRAKEKGDNLAVYSCNLSIIDRVLNKIFPFISPVININELVWSIKALFAINKHIAQYKGIIIPYEPYSTVLIQYVIKSFYKHVRIFVIMYDPFADNCFFNQSFWGIKLRLLVEKLIAYHANALVVNNSKLYYTMIKRYPNSRIELIPLCGKNRIKPSSNQCKFEKYTIVYTGNIFGKRTLNPLNKTISILKDRIDKLSDKLQILIYGNICLGYENIQASNNDDIIIYMGHKDVEEIDCVLFNADAFLLIDPLDENNYSFPSKLCEYFQYGKPIFAFAGKNTPSYIALKDSGNIVCTENEENTMSQYLQNMLLGVDLGKRPSPHFGLQFNPSKVASQYNVLINSVLYS